MMNRPHRFRLTALHGLALLLCTGTASAAAQSPSALPEVAPDVRARLMGAAADPALRGWQRDLMLEVAGSRAPRVEPYATTAPDAPLFATGRAPDARVTAIDGSWRIYFADGRYAASTIYDPVRKRMIVFGGTNEQGVRNDTWALSLTGAAVWTQIATASVPPVRYGHSAIYDSMRDRMVIFGGYDDTNRLRDVWALSLSGTPAWTNITPPGGILTGPTARYYHTAIYDPVRDRMLVLGGYDSFYLGDVWALPFSGTVAWSQLTPAGPSAGLFVDHTTIYDPVRDRLLTFGGYDGTNRRNDTWALTLGATPTWSLIAVTGTQPPPITAIRGAYDPVRDRLVIFGGYDTVGYYEDKAWALTLSGTPTWSLLAPGGTPPMGRAEAAVAYDPNGDRLVINAGTYGPDGLIYQTLDDTRALSLAGAPAWSAMPPGDAPAGRTRAGAVCDPASRRMLLFGGVNNLNLYYTNFNDVHAFSLDSTPTWTVLQPTGTPPTPRAAPIALYDGSRNRMMVFGGVTSAGPVSDLWALSLSGAPAWTQITPAGTPPSARTGSSAVYDSQHDRIVVFGGFYGGTYYNDVWQISLSGTPTWTQLTPSGAPPLGRENLVALYDAPHHRMLIYGGWNASNLTDAWALDLGASPSWSQIPPEGAGPVDQELRGVYDPVRDRMLIVDGGVFALKLSGTPTWSVLTTGGAAFPPHTLAAVAYDPVADQMLVACGYSSRLMHDVGSLYWGTPLADVEGTRGAGGFALAAPHPNPALGSSSIEFDVPRAARVRLAIFDLQGRQVRRLEDAPLAPGHYTRSWDGADADGAAASAGVYFIQLVAPGVNLRAKLVRLR